MTDQNTVPEVEVTIPEMDMSEAESQRPPSVGWHKAVVKDVKTMYSAADMDLPPTSRRKNFVLNMSLAPDSEKPGYSVGALYIPIPTDDEADFHFKHKNATSAELSKLKSDFPDMFTADGRTKYSQKMDWMKKASTVFGGKESGKLSKAFFTKKIGETIMVNIEHSEWQGEIQGRIKFMGIKPL